MVRSDEMRVMLVASLTSDYHAALLASWIDVPRADMLTQSHAFEAAD